MHGGAEAFEYLVGEPELNEAFNRAMADTTEMAVDYLMAAYSFEAYPTVVDVGGGVGRLLSAILKVTPTARGVLYDLPHAARRSPTRVAPARCRRSSGVAGGIVLRQRSHGWRRLRAQDDPA